MITENGFRRCGIPEDIQSNLPFYDLINSVSGRELECEVWPHYIHIASVERGPDGIPLCFFTAAAGDGLCCFSIQTVESEKDEKKIYHPDLFARALAVDSIYHFEQQGYEVRAITAIWEDIRLMNGFRRSDEFNSFLNTLKMCSCPKEKDYKTAALSTWTGRIARQLGFDRIPQRGVSIRRDLSGGIYLVEAVFMRRGPIQYSNL